MSIFSNIFDKMKSGVMEKLLEKQLSKLPPEQREKVKQAFMKNPELFEKIAKEIEALQKQGKNQMFASMEVMKKYEDQIRKAMQ
ncbi:MAG TPA: hypothetical protein VGE63_00895 [Candidatus Paceibacterota bacterium]